MTNTTMTTTAEQFKHVLAFDVGKFELVLQARPGAPACEEIRNDPAIIRRRLKAELRRNAKLDVGPLLVVCEATGGYERHVLAVAHELGIACHRAHGSQVRYFARYRGTHAKTDKIDAGVLAKFALQTGDLRLHEMEREATAALRALVTRRADLIKMIGAERCRLEHATNKIVVRDIKSLIAIFERRKAAIEAQIDDLMKSDAILADADELLQSVKGVGERTVQAVLAFLPEIGTLTRATVASLVGLAPFARDSGTSNKPRHIHAGRAEVRRCLKMAAECAIKHSPPMQTFANRLLQKGKPWKVVVTAVMRKLIVTMNAIIRDGEPWKHAKTA